MSSQPAPQPRFVAHRVADLQLRGATGRRRARAYWPSPSSTAGDPALLVLFGGHESMFDGLDGTDSLGRGLCVLSGVVVLSASPPTGLHRASPIAVDDATAIVGWAADHATDLGADPHQLVLAGEGSSAAVVAAVALHARDHGWPHVVRQLLIEPDSDSSRDAFVSGVAPAMVVTVSSEADQSLVELASALRLALQASTRGRPGRPRSAGASDA